VIYDNLIYGCASGIAVKDQSQALILFNTFADNAVAVELFQKKSMFGGSVAEVANCVFYLNRKVLVSDPQSKIHLSASLGQGGELSDGVEDVAFTLPGLEKGDARIPSQTIPSGYRLNTDLPKSGNVLVQTGDSPGCRVDLSLAKGQR
jgi:hypothetical protein